MFDEIDRAYFTRCAREAEARAERVADPLTRRAHLDIAAEYRRRADELLPLPLVTH